MDMKDTAVIIMAGGRGKRMKSDLPKVLHNLAGKPILKYVLDTVNKLQLKRKILIVGYKSEKIRELIGDKVEYVEQSEPLGTAHAVLQTKKVLSDFKGDVLILSGDVPFLAVKTIKRLIRHHKRNDFYCTLISTILENPEGYGRIIRDKEGEIKGIVEEMDLSADKKEIKEINTGIYCFDKEKLFKTLEKINPDNNQGEYYLTDSIKMLSGEGLAIGNIMVEEYLEAFGINTRVDLARASQEIYQRVAHNLMLQGVTIIDSHSTFISPEIKIGRDSIIYPFTIIEGNCKIGEKCIVGPYSHLINTRIGREVKIWSSIAEDSIIEDKVIIGPYSHLRPKSIIKKGAKIGNFVETKKTIVGEGSKTSHLTYLGDAVIGKRVNIGAGTITCNYDGEKKNTTIIGDEVFIGSNNSLVAPVKLGKKSYTGAGSTITKDVPVDNLAIARSKQKNISGWGKRRKNKK
jgi:bifunctional UDP-N-acetylglucosamine pyrophosphorylase/glucosamine-1-phosphate N-acetyltransferase